MHNCIILNLVFCKCTNKTMGKRNFPYSKIDIGMIIKDRQEMKRNKVMKVLSCIDGCISDLLKCIAFSVSVTLLVYLCCNGWSLQVG